MAADDPWAARRSLRLAELSGRALVIDRRTGTTSPDLWPPEERPAIVHVVDELPVTTWYRPMTRPLRQAGIPEPTEGTQIWYLDASGEQYRPLTAAARRRLLAA